jgi:SAM-dependent methyltransferase
LFDPRLTAGAKKLIPTGLYHRLDPYAAAIDGFVRGVAAEIPEGMRVLDVCLAEDRFKQLFGHAKYVGVDFGRGIEELPFEDGSFDHVLSISVLQHTPQPQRVIAEFQRVLRRGGMVHLVVPHMWNEHGRPPDFFRFTSKGIRYLLESSGIRIRRIHPIGGYFWQLGRNLAGVPSFSQQGWGWLLFPLTAPVFGLVLPLCCYYLDSLDQDRSLTLGFIAEGWKT